MTTDKSSQCRVEVTRSFVKDLRKLPRRDQLRVRRSLDEITNDPYSGRKVTTATIGQYRRQVGGYRIRYDIEGQVVWILRIVKREDAYRKF